MISIDALSEGFVLSVGGRKILSHTRRNPCVELCRGESLVKQSRGRFSLRSRHEDRIPLRSFRIVESSADFVVIDFEGLISMAVREREGRLRISFSRYDASINRFKLRIAARPEESIFGCGESFGRLDLKRRRAEVWLYERGSGSGLGAASFSARRRGAGGDMESPAHAVPAFASTEGLWCVVDAASHTTFDFRRAATCIESWSVPREVVLGLEGRGEASIAGLGSFLGKAPMPPDWCFDGAWLGVSGGLVAIDSRLSEVRESGAAVAAVWVPDWCGIPSTFGRPAAASEWKADESLYPRLAQEIEVLRAKGIRFVGRIDPYLSPEGELGKEALARGFCVKDREGRDYLMPCHASPVAMIDLTNAEAFAWIKELIARELLGIGMSAWAADGGELLPADAVLASGESGLEAHNLWPALWARANREAIEEAGRAADVTFFVRSSWLGSARYAMGFWGGENLPLLDGALGLEGALASALSMSFAGALPWHTEAGGNIDVRYPRRRPEVLARWMEAAAFSPLFRTSARGRTGSIGRPPVDAMPWSDPLSLSVFSRMSRAFAALKSYHLAVAAEATERGLPPIRHPWIHYPDDPIVKRITRQYLYGRDLMVAPALELGATLTRLYLPDDEWVHLWTSRSFRGGEVEIESPMGYPAVFYRACSTFASLFDVMRRTGRRS